jgi:phosphoribosylformylglycinamidine synthase subunit PurQ / glutaminase
MARGVDVMVLAGNGINCELETAHACRLAGADRVEIVYLWDLASGRASLGDYAMLCLPGGFLDGDDLGSARASAIRIRHTRVGGETLLDQLRRFVADGGLMIGICNGFQLMVKLGLLPALESCGEGQQLSLTWNDSGRFEDRWVDLAVDEESPCVFTRGLGGLSLPVRHGEGRIVAADQTVLKEVDERHRAPLRYVDPRDGKPTETYPHNPNGSPGGVAALTDESGRLLGMMPHPEGFLDRTNHPRWTRENLPEQGDGLALFQNAVEFLKSG